MAGFAACALACGSDGGAPQRTTMVQPAAEKTSTQPRSYFVDGPAGKLLVDDGGEGGIPIVFLHSYAGDVSHWAQQLQHERQFRRAVAIDLRAHGKSDAPHSTTYAVSDFSDDLAAVVDKLKMSKFVLVGHSLGGVAAIDFAGKHPEKVVGLVMVATPGKLPTEMATKILSSLDADYDNVMKAYWDKLLLDAKPDVSLKIRNSIGLMPPPTSKSIITAITAYDPMLALSRYEGPALVINTPDGEKPFDLQKLEPRINAKIVSGTSHWIQLDKPDEFNKILDDFIASSMLIASRHRAAR